MCRCKACQLAVARPRSRPRYAAGAPARAAKHVCSWASLRCGRALTVRRGPPLTVPQVAQLDWGPQKARATGAGRPSGSLWNPSAKDSRPQGVGTPSMARAGPRTGQIELGTQWT